MSDGAIEIGATDYHTAGEPFRIVTHGMPEIAGTTVLERRETARSSESIDAVRRLLCHEPRGHADMYGCFVVPPNDAGAHLGVLFWHKDGYSTACGHGTIALAEWAVRTGRVEAARDGETRVVIDVPSGRVEARVTRRRGRTERIVFRNVPAYVLARGLAVPTARGEIRADVAYGGAIYASVEASSLGLTVSAGDHGELVAVGREIRRRLDATDVGRHPSDRRLDGLYGTILFEDLGETATGLHQRNVTVFADGEVDRSPCGSGTSARLALLAAEGRLAGEPPLIHDSIIGTRFIGRVVERTRAEGRDAVVTEIEGTAHRTGEHVFVLERDDPLETGFLLR